jgi:DNA repair exonuclease SbcCD ATPase subunit
MATPLHALVTIRGISFDGGNTYPIQRDSDEWRQWFATTPQGGKIRFEWLNGSAIEHNFTAYRRKRYWEAQKRISGKLRNTTIKPEEVTYQKLEQVGYDLIAYNWQSRFEPDDSSQSGKSQPYQTPGQTPGAIAPEVERLKAELEAANQTIKNQATLLKLAQEEVILAQKDASESKALVTAYKEQWDDEVNELTSRIEPLTRDQAQHQVTKLKLSQTEQKVEKLESLVKDYQTKLERAKTIDLRSLDDPKAKPYQLRGEMVIYTKHLEQLGFQVKRG